MPSDIKLEHIIFTRTPVRWHPYIKLMRLDRPVGIWLLLLPCLWAIALARHGVFSFGLAGWLHVILFGTGAVVMRGAGCVINDLWDHKLDAAVARTRTRPLPAGDVTRRQAFVFLAVLLASGLAILLCFNRLTDILGIASLALVAIYPAMKRITWWPQAFLGLTFNWGTLMGWTAATGTLDTPALLLYAGGFFWTLAYDTIYAHQDKTDDELIGIRSTARLFGTNSKKWVAGFFGIAVLCLVIAKYIAFPSVLTPLLTVSLVAHAARQLWRWDMDDADSSLAVFKSNRDFGLLVLVMMAV
jgi:4-hydroxybenzoate polyprenyltransferase